MIIICWKARGMLKTPQDRGARPSVGGGARPGAGPKRHYLEAKAVHGLVLEVVHG